MNHFRSFKQNAKVNILYVVWEQLIAHMRCSEREEVCGILIGKKVDESTLEIQKYRRIRNLATDPVHSFMLDPKEWIQCCYQEPNLIGLFHSHPHSAPVPSQEDLDQLPEFADMISIYLIGSPTTINSKLQLNESTVQAKQHLSSTCTPSLKTANSRSTIRAYAITRQVKSSPTNSDQSLLLYPYTLVPVPISLY